MNFLELINELEQLNVKVTLAGDRLRLEAPAGVLTPELKELLSAHKQEATCFLLWQSMLDRCNRDYRPGALAWCRQHFPELVKSLFEAEQQYQTAYQQQDIEAVQQAAADWEAILKRICLLHQLAEGGEVLSEAEAPLAIIKKERCFQ